MPHFVALIMPLALLFPQPQQGAAIEGENKPAQLTPDADPQLPPPAPGWILFDDHRPFPPQYQVRIEQRVIIRISPQRSPRTDLTATMPRSAPTRRMVERKIGKCLPVGSIAGVMPSQDNRLMLFMRDQRIIAANLEKACSARDFYSGFYVEPRRDGQICVDRDKLQSRTGAKCEISRIRQLVAVDT